MKKIQIPLAEDLLKMINIQTHYAKKSLEHNLAQAKDAEKDSEKEKRLNKRECKNCFYFRTGRIGGQAMTPHNCELCRSPMLFSSTVTNKICVTCSIKYGLCSFCFSQIELLSVDSKTAKLAFKKKK